MATWQLALIVALAAPILGLVGTIIANRFAKPKSDADARKSDAEATQTITATAMTMINEMQEQIIDLRKQAEIAKTRADIAESIATTAKIKVEAMVKRVEELEIQVIDLANKYAEACQGIAILQAQIRVLGHEPAYDKKLGSF
jgi:hypothetical protein